MKFLAFVLLLSLFLNNAFSQRRFIKTNSDVGYGLAMRIIPANNQGWIIASMDSLRITRFDQCGRKVWSKRLFIPNQYPSLTDIISLRNGDCLLLTRKGGVNNSYSLLTRLDTSGNILWSKSYEETYYDQYGYSISEDANQNIVLYANLDHVSVQPYLMLCKLNSAGNIIWSKSYDIGGVYGGSIVTSDNGALIRTGDFFIKTDSTGSIQWTNYGTSANTYHYTTPVEVSDGYIFTKYKNGSNQVVFYKWNKQGILVPGSSRVSNYTGSYPRLKVTSSGTVVGIFNVGNIPTLVEMDKDLNVLRQGSVNYSGLTLTAKDFCFSGNEAIIAGYTSSSTMFFAKLDDLYKSSCDTVMPLMQTTPDSAAQFNLPINVTPYVLNEVSYFYSSVDVLDEQYTVCTVPLQLELGPDITICSSSSMILRNNLLGLFNEYHWSTGETTQYIYVNQPGKYWVEAIQYCEDSLVRDSINITIDSVPQTDWEESVTECENSPVVLHAPYCSQCIYQWSTGETSDSIVVTLSGRYGLIVENVSRCQSEDSIDVEFGKCECELYVPNSFTPNNDGINEIFKPVYYCDMVNFEMRIFNRMGKVVYTSTNSEEGWNGFTKDSAGIEDIYNYTIQYTPVIKGKATSSINKAGMVALIY